MRLINIPLILGILASLIPSTIGAAEQSSEQLLLVVEVSRHGSRSPNQIFPFALKEEENFQNKSELMQYGRYQQYKLGQYIRQKYIKDLGFLSSTYDEREVYAQTTYLNRTYLSALYQLLGMYPDNKPHNLDYDFYEICYEKYLTPLQRNEVECKTYCDQNFIIHQINQTFDYLLHLDTKNCPRFHLMHGITKQSPQYGNISSHFIAEFGPRLTELTGLDNFSQKNITKVCGYLQWARYANISLKFKPNSLDERYCLAIGDSKLFYNAYGNDEIWKISGFEFINQLDEFIDIIVKGKRFDRKPFWSKYFQKHFHQNLKKDQKPVFPKFIHYSAHAETLGVFLAALGIERVTRVLPGSALFIEFLKDGKEHYVRFVLKTEDEPEVVLKIRHQSQDRFPLTDFKAYLKKRMFSEGQTPQYLQMECDNMNYDESNIALLDPYYTIQRLYDFYNLEPVNYDKSQKQPGEKRPVQAQEEPKIPIKPVEQQKPPVEQQKNATIEQQQKPVIIQEVKQEEPAAIVDEDEVKDEESAAPQEQKLQDIPVNQYGTKKPEEPIVQAEKKNEQPIIQKDKAEEVRILQDGKKEEPIVNEVKEELPVVQEVKQVEPTLTEVKQPESIPIVEEKKVEPVPIKEQQSEPIPTEEKKDVPKVQEVKQPKIQKINPKPQQPVKPNDDKFRRKPAGGGNKKNDL